MFLIVLLFACFSTIVVNKGFHQVGMASF